jgi:hypothetical protein
VKRSAPASDAGMGSRGRSVGEKASLLVIFAALVVAGGALLLRSALPEQDRGDRLRLPDPGFFISSGVSLDLSGLLDVKFALLRVPLFLLTLLVVRGVPAVLSAGRIGRSHAVASGLLQATSLPFIVTASQIGVAAGLMTPETEAGPVCAGPLSVMIFPVIDLGLLRTAPRGASSIAVAGRT